jgi:hypothetical protein
MCQNVTKNRCCREPCQNESKLNLKLGVHQFHAYSVVSQPYARFLRSFSVFRVSYAHPTSHSTRFLHANLFCLSPTPRVAVRP